MRCPHCQGSGQLRVAVTLRNGRHYPRSQPREDRSATVTELVPRARQTDHAQDDGPMAPVIDLRAARTRRQRLRGPTPVPD